MVEVHWSLTSLDSTQIDSVVVDLTGEQKEYSFGEAYGCNLPCDHVFLAPTLRKEIPVYCAGATSGKYLPTLGALLPGELLYAFRGCSAIDEDHRH